MDKERFEKGVAQRSAVLGADYVQRTLDNADEFNRPFQERPMFSAVLSGSARLSGGVARREERGVAPLHE